MAYPNDLSDVVLFKIHPAIGVARVSDSDDYYIFGRDPGTYKSDGRMRRQAVQFRVFAYGENHVGLGELTPEVMNNLNIATVWTAKVANRKIALWENTPLSGNAFVISAEASSNDANNGQLTGSLPSFQEGARIPLGQITSTGLFIPPRGQVFRKTAGLEIPWFPAKAKDIADTTCDGSISVRLTKGGQDLEALAACILVAPQDFSPDVDPDFSLLDYLRAELHLPAMPGPGNLHNQLARSLDEMALASCTARFAPGFEASFGDRGEVTDVRPLFHKSDQNPKIDPREVRVRYRDLPAEPGAVLGQLTSGLCSPWQGDFTACVGYWTEYLPPEAFLDEDSSVGVNVFRWKYDDFAGETLTTGDDFDRHVDKVGVVRQRNGKLIETERDPGDDIDLNA